MQRFPCSSKECSAIVFILAGLVKDASRFPPRFRLETRHVEGCVERSRVPSRNSASQNLRGYRCSHCDRVYCCLRHGVPLPFWSWRHVACGPLGTISPVRILLFGGCFSSPMDVWFSQRSLVLSCEDRALRWTVGWFRRCSTLCGDLPSATWKSFFTNATGGYPGGVWGLLPSLRDRAASDQGPRHRTVTYGVVAARRPQVRGTVQLRTNRNLVAPGATPPCQPGTVRIVMWRC